MKTYELNAFCRYILNRGKRRHAGDTLFVVEIINELTVVMRGVFASHNCSIAFSDHAASCRLTALHSAGAALLPKAI